MWIFTTSCGCSSCPALLHPCPCAPSQFQFLVTAGSAGTPGIPVNMWKVIKEEFCGRTFIYFSDWILSWVWLDRIFSFWHDRLQIYFYKLLVSLCSLHSCSSLSWKGIIIFLFNWLKLHVHWTKGKIFMQMMLPCDFCWLLKHREDK